MEAFDMNAILPIQWVMDQVVEVEQHNDSNNHTVATTLSSGEPLQIKNDMSDFMLIKESDTANSSTSNRPQFDEEGIPLLERPLKDHKFEIKNSDGFWNSKKYRV